MNGTLINAVAVILGGSIGLLVHKNLPRSLVKIAFQGIGLFTLFLGFLMASEASNFVIMIFSIVIGGVIGELIKLDELLDRSGELIKTRLGSREDKFVDGFVTSTLLFCVGSMSILGAIEEGLGGEPNLLLAKSLLDGLSSIALASSMGVGVLVSVVPMIIYQGGISIFAGWVDSFLTEIMISEMTGVGGLLLIGLGLTLLEIKKIKVINMLPSLFIALLLAYFFS